MTREMTTEEAKEDKEDNKGKRTPLVVTPALVVIILVLLNVKEANVIVDTLLLMRKDISSRNHRLA